MIRPLSVGLLLLPIAILCRGCPEDSQWLLGEGGDWKAFLLSMQPRDACFQRWDSIFAIHAASCPHFGDRM